VTVASRPLEVEKGVVNYRVAVSGVGSAAATVMLAAQVVGATGTSAKAAKTVVASRPKRTV
jgi:hypothetical protein